MAGIGLYGVYYSKGVLTSGVLTGYSGVSTLGKAISATFEPADNGGDNNLWANNAIAETDSMAGAGGTLTLTLDRLKAAARQEIYGLTASTASVTVNSATVTGNGEDYTGSESAPPVGVGFIKWNQEDNDRAKYEAVIFSYCTFQAPSETAETYNGDNGIEWQTPELEATVSGGTVTGTYPWRKRFVFPSQAAAEQFITDYFAASNP